MLKLNTKEFLGRTLIAGFKRAHLDEKFISTLCYEKDIPAKIIKEFKKSTVGFVGGGEKTLYFVICRKPDQTISLEESKTKFSQFIKSTILVDKNAQEDVFSSIGTAYFESEDKINANESLVMEEDNEANSEESTDNTEKEEKTEDSKKESGEDSKEERSEKESASKSKLYLAVGIKLVD